MTTTVFREPSVEERVTEFVRKLEGRYRERPEEKILSEHRAGRAVLKRYAGKTLANARGAEILFFELNPPKLPSDAPGEEYETAFLIATLFCLAKGRTGSSLSKEVRALEKDGHSFEALKRRTIRLLDCTESRRLSYHLRQMIKLLASKGRGVDWYQLSKDLSNWNHPKRHVQRRWADELVRVSTKTTQDDE